jgi:hypothetical protein
MNHMLIIRRAWEILRRYRVLWIFGILIALTSGGGGNGNGASWSANSNRMGTEPFRNVPWLADVVRPDRIAGLIALCCCLLLVVGIITAIIRYVSRAALIRSVDQIEATGVAPTWKQGFRLGWTNRTFRLFVLELIVGFVVGLAALLLLALAASPLLLLLTDTDAGRIIGIALTVMLGIVVVLLLLVVGLILSVLAEFWSREILLADRSIGEALTEGYAHVRRRLRDVGLMWLLLLGIGIGFSIVLIPIVLALVALGVGVGGGLGWLLYQATNSTLWAVAFGLPVGLLLFVIPLSIVGGLYSVFTHSVWTLTYREVSAPPALPAPVVVEEA